MVTVIECSIFIGIVLLVAVPIIIIQVLVNKARVTNDAQELINITRKRILTSVLLLVIVVAMGWRALSVASLPDTAL